MNLRPTYGAHLGGALTGGRVAIDRTWNNRPRRPSLGPFAIAISCAFTVLMVTGFCLANGRAPVYAAETTTLIPQSQFSGDSNQWAERSSDWIEHYPQDSRGYFYKGLDLLLNRRDVPGQRSSFVKRSLFIPPTKQASRPPSAIA